MFVTKDPNKAFINLGKLGLTASVPEDELTEEQKNGALCLGPCKIPPKMKSGGKVSSASKRADGIAVKGKTKGRMV
jgi:hypothetical protein